jgi:DNA-binding transcriptional LysR family regulator
MDINFELYKIFYHTARSGSFSSAAKQLFITQSAVSQAINNLEEKIGSRLFIRKSRSILFTTEGEILFKHVEQAYNFIKTAEGKLLEMHSLSIGEIRIGVGDTICRYFLIPYLKHFISLHPNIKIKVINRTSPQIIEILKNGQIDFGIVTLPVNDESVVCRDFKEVRDVFVAGGRFKELKKPDVPISELIGYPLLLLQKDSATRRNLDGFLLQKGFTVIPEIELESIELLVEFARIGLGIAHVLKESAAALVESGELFIVNTVETLQERKLGIATVKNVPLSKASSGFIELLNMKN